MRLKVEDPLAAIVTVVVGVLTPLMLVGAMFNGLCMGVGIMLTLCCIAVGGMTICHGFSMAPKPTNELRDKLDVDL